MRVVISVNVLFLVFFSSISANAASRFWVSAVSLNWSNGAGWSATSGGAPGASVPVAADAVFFDGNGLGNCNGDMPVTVVSITIGSGYTGTISQNANAMVLTGAAALSGGIFNGGSSNITVGGAFTLSGTTFTSTSAILELRNSAAFTSGVFLHNNGTVKFNCINNAAQTITGNAPVFYILEFAGIARTYTMSALVGNITVLNSLNTSGTLFYNLAGGTIDVKGNINSTNTATGSGGDATININGNSPQTFTGSTVIGAGAIPQLNINTTGTLALVNNPAVSNNFTYTAGTVNAGGSTFCFTHGNVGAYNINGSLTLNNIAFPINTSLTTMTIGGTITAAGDLSISGAGGVILNTGNINVNGNINLTNTTTNGGGSATINIVGTGPENLDGSAIIVNQSRLPIININKTSGSLSLFGNISFSNNLTYTAGTVNAGTSTCFIVNNLTITGIFSVFNLTILAGGNTTVTVAPGSTILATNTLDLENGANYITINTGTIAVQGNIIDNNTSIGGGGNGIILINGTANQSITTTGVTDQGRFPGVTINKPSGTLTLPSTMTVRFDWTYIAGTLDVTTNNSTVVFENTMKITGTHTLNNISFNGQGNYTYTFGAATTLTALGNLSMTGANNVDFNKGNINLFGNMSLTNTSIGDGGSTVISFVGTANQSITSSLPVNQSSLPSVTINKTGGTLTFPALLTTRGNTWTYTAGTYDVATNNSNIVFAGPLAGNTTITGSHTLNNVTFEGSNNNIINVSTATTLIVSGTFSTSGANNVFINTPVLGATAVQAQGNININNTSLAGGGTGTILINGAGAQAFTSAGAVGIGQLPYLTIQKPSGTLTMSGVFSVTRDWNFISGTVDATTNATTVAFGWDNLTIASAGMSFYNLTVTSNSVNLANNLTIAGNLTINGTGILLAFANSINLAGNWTSRNQSAFTEATSTVNFNGSGLQIITTPGGENFTNVIVKNAAAGVQLANAVAIATSLTMTLGNIDLNSNAITLGTSALLPGTLNYSSGTMINTGSFTRWFAKSTIAVGAVTGLFPTGTSTDYRPFNVSVPVAPTTGGTITISYTNLTTNTTTSFADGAFTVMVRKDLNWSVSTATLAGGTYNLQIQGTSFGIIGSVTDLRLTLVSSVVGTAGVNGGTISNPQVTRTGLTAVNLTNTFFLGSVNSVSSPLPVKLVSFTAFPKNQTIDLKWETAIETQNDYFTIYRSRDGKVWDSVTSVYGKGNFSENTFYETFDNNPYTGLSYYRLKNTDFNGKEYFSPIRTVSFDKNNSQIKVYPNPAVSTIVVESGDEITSIKLMSSGGQIIPVPILGNNSSRVLNVSTLPSGIYFIQITEGNNTEIKTVIIGR